jgi:hypothetical protein
MADLDQVVDSGALLVRSGSSESSASDERGDDSSEGLHYEVELVVKSVVLTKVCEIKRIC